MGQSTGILVIANLTPILFAGLGFGTTLQVGLSVAWIVCALLGAFVHALLMDKVGRVKPLCMWKSTSFDSKHYPPKHPTRYPNKI